MKITAALFILAAAVLCAGAAFAGDDPEAYRQTLLSRPLPSGPQDDFCKSKDNYADCQVTLNFLKDINAGTAPKDSSKGGKDLCPRGANIKYSGNGANQAKIEARCV